MQPQQQPFPALAALALAVALLAVSSTTSVSCFLLRPTVSVGISITRRSVSAAFLSSATSGGNSNSSNASEDDNNDNDSNQQELLLSSNDIEKQMQSLKSKFPTSEADYLAAARQRAQEARASINSSASDEEWKQVANASQQQESDNDWDRSLSSQDSVAESQILIPKQAVQQSDGDDSEDDDEEPKLLLF